MLSVSFSIESNDFDALDLHGVVRAVAAGLEVESAGERRRYDDDGELKETKAIPLGTICIPWAELKCCELQQPWLRAPRLLIETHSVRVWGGFPLARGTVAEIPLARRAAEEARDLASEAMLRMADAAG